jgi:dTDP-4-dehydrorhamnose reductase
LTAGGETSWFGFAQAIGEQLVKQGKPCATLEPIPASAYPTPAERPQNSRLDCSLLRDEWQVRLPDWHSAMLECLAGQQ